MLAKSVPYSNVCWHILAQLQFLDRMLIFGMSIFASPKKYKRSRTRAKVAVLVSSPVSTRSHLQFAFLFISTHYVDYIYFFTKEEKNILKILHEELKCSKPRGD